MLAERLAAPITACGFGVGLGTGFLAALVDRLQLLLQLLKLPAQLRVVRLQVGVRRFQLGQALQEQLAVVHAADNLRKQLQNGKRRLNSYHGGWPILRSGPAQTLGVEDHVLDGVRGRITSPPRTVVDCVKYCSKIGLDVAIEALRDCWRQKKKATMDDRRRTARLLRMTNVMRPYLESLT